MDKIDLAILGAGPAGLTAGIYASRSGIKSLILEKGLPGGLANTTDLIENFPGFPEGISGMELGELMRKQASRFEAEIATTDVTRIWKDDDRVRLDASRGPVEARSAIVATGSNPKQIGVPGERELTGKGVSYCATCDGPLYRDQVTAVIGGGDSALQEALYLTGFASRVIVIHRRNEFRAAAVLQERVRSNDRIQLALNKKVEAIEGGDSIAGVKVTDKESGKTELIQADGVFIFVGYSPNGEPLGPEFERDQAGFLVTDRNLQTSVPGVFAAGDIRAKSLRQVVTAAGDGAVAAMSAYAYLHRP
jgi:thioredoxin reductase (NADPH)